MKPTFLVVILAMLSISCAPLANMNPYTMPPLSLGEIGKSTTTLLNKEMHQVGKPSLSQPIALTARQVPFTKEEFRKYAEINKLRGKETKIQFIDSLPVKPKYISLEIADKVALSLQLNADHNHETQSYLAKDEDYKIVLQVSGLARPALTQKLLLADGVFLMEDRNDLLAIELVKDNSRETFALSELEVFDYESGGFCWGLDRYGNEKIEAIALHGESCPKDTERKAYKLDRTKPYLKL